MGTIPPTVSSRSGTTKRTAPTRGDARFFTWNIRRRYLVAAVLSIVINVLGVVLLFPRWTTPSQPHVVAQTVTLSVLPRATPTPTPPPVVHPAVIAPTRVAAPIIDPGKSAQLQPIKHHGESAPTVHTRYHLKPVWDLQTGAQGAGAGKGSGAGSLGLGGNGNGISGNGNGNGGTNAAEPCGFVEFSNPHGSIYDKATGGFFVDIRITVHYPDRSVQSLILDYPFYYKSENANPFSDRNAADDTIAVLFQQPPSDKAPNEPALVQYVMQHSTKDGYTRLQDCPPATAAP